MNFVFGVSFRFRLSKSFWFAILLSISHHTLQITHAEFVLGCFLSWSHHTLKITHTEFVMGCYLSWSHHTLEITHAELVLGCFLSSIEVIIGSCSSSSSSIAPTEFILWCFFILSESSYRVRSLESFGMCLVLKLNGWNIWDQKDGSKGCEFHKNRFVLLIINDLICLVYKAFWIDLTTILFNDKIINSNNYNNYFLIIYFS